VAVPEQSWWLEHLIIVQMLGSEVNRKMAVAQYCVQWRVSVLPALNLRILLPECHLVATVPQYSVYIYIHTFIHTCAFLGRPSVQSVLRTCDDTNGLQVSRLANVANT